MISEHRQLIKSEIQLLQNMKLEQGLLIILVKLQIQQCLSSNIETFKFINYDSIQLRQYFPAICISSFLLNGNDNFSGF